MNLVKGNDNEHNLSRTNVTVLVQMVCKSPNTPHNDENHELWENDFQLCQDYFSVFETVIPAISNLVCLDQPRENPRGLPPLGFPLGLAIACGAAYGCGKGFVDTFLNNSTQFSI